MSVPKVASRSGVRPYSEGFFFDGSEKLIVKLKGSIEVKSDMVPVSGSGDTIESTIIYEINRELL